MIILDGVKINTDDFIVENLESLEEKTSIRFEFYVIGESNYNLYNNLLKSGPATLEIPSENLKLNMKRDQLSSSYKDLMDENTKVSFSVTYVEADETNEWDQNTGLFITNLMNWARTRALSEILIENGLITKEAYDEKIADVLTRDKEEMLNFISTGKDIEK